MGRRLFVGTVVVTALLGATGFAKSTKLSKAERLALLKRAQVWRATDVETMDLKTGPQVKGAFAPGETITCDYVNEKLGGATPKFSCALTPEDHLKVRYGRENGEVYGSVAATRLLWALGFGADAVYPVHVICRGCPPEIKGDSGSPKGETHFDIAAVERKFAGHDLEVDDKPGWAWTELDQVDERAGGAPAAQRDAFKLLAAMLQHTDNKMEQQRFVCLESAAASTTDTQAVADTGGTKKAKAKGTSGKEDVASCEQPFLMIHDVGQTFGRANLYNKNALGSVNFERWSEAAMWEDAKHCVARLTASATGSLENPKIGEPGRKFLSDLLARLSDQQITDLFEVARFSERPLPNGTGGAPIQAWVDTFKKKRQEIAATTCP